jgi:hypothetical protein
MLAVWLPNIVINNKAKEYPFRSTGGLFGLKNWLKFRTDYFSLRKDRTFRVSCSSSMFHILVYPYAAD